MWKRIKGTFPNRVFAPQMTREHFLSAYGRSRDAEMRRYCDSEIGKTHSWAGWVSAEDDERANTILLQKQEVLDRCAADDQALLDLAAEYGVQIVPDHHQQGR